MLLSGFKRRFRSLSSDAQGWLVCSAVVLLTTVRSGIPFSFGLFVAKMESENNKTAMVVQDWIGILVPTISYSLSPFSVLLIRTMGHHGYQMAEMIGVLMLTCSCCLSSVVVNINELWMYLTHSVIFGVGNSLLFMSTSLILGEYFGKEHKHHVFATSLSVCGYPISSLVFNPINGWLVDVYGVSLALRVNGCIILVVGLCCSLFFLSKSDTDTNNAIDCEDFKQRIASCCNFKLCFVRPEIFLWFLGAALSYITFILPFVNLAHYMALKDIGLAQSKWAVTVLSGAECIMYMIASAVGDRFRGKLVYVNVAAALGLSVTCFVWPFVDNSYGAIIANCAVMGALLALSVVYQYAACAEVTPLPIDVAWSATNGWSGLGMMAGPLFSGAVFDIRHQYKDVWLVSGALNFAQALVFAAIPLIWFCRRGSCVPENYSEISGETMEIETDIDKGSKQ